MPLKNQIGFVLSRLRPVTSEVSGKQLLCDSWVCVWGGGGGGVGEFSPGGGGGGGGGGDLGNLVRV